MNDARRRYRQVEIGSTVPQAVTVGIERDGAGGQKAAVWWQAVGDIDGEELEFIDVAAALDAADAARILHGFTEVVVSLQDGVAWQAGWGDLSPLATGHEPMGDVRGAGLSESEAFALAVDIEAERDA